MAKRHEVNGQYVVTILVLAAIAGLASGSFFLGVVVFFFLGGLLVFTGKLRL